MFLSVYSSLQNVLQLVGIIVVFLIILAAAYVASVLVGKTQNNAYHSKDRNIKLIEVFRINNNQFLQIVRIGKRYFALAISKEQIELITELAEEEVFISEVSDAAIPFQNVLETVKQKLPKTQKDKKK